MKFGIVTSYGSIHDYVAMATEAEVYGWDGVFTSGTDPAADSPRLDALAQAGATWWIESRWGSDQSPETLLERIRIGPPRP